jgi:pimeloyl-ACP methyl ester carboxylesterase
MADIEARDIQTEDLKVRYLVAGEGGDREPVVLVHGFPQTSHEWRHQLVALAEAGHPVYAPDNRGFGGTDKPRMRISRELLAGDVLRFMDAIGIQQAALAGHDWGGIIAFKAAIDNPDRFSRLMLLDTLCTVWVPFALHGYWFKAEPLPEQFFAQHARGFIEALFGPGDFESLGPRPGSPWGYAGEMAGRGEPKPWATEDDLAHYVEAFSDPDAHFAAIQYYRYALPFHRVTADDQATHGERFQSLSEREVAELWLHPEGIENHPEFVHYYDYGPQDRHKRYPNPTLWMYATTAPDDEGSPDDDTAIPGGNPFNDQFPRYFPDLRARRVNCGHFIPEEAPDYTNETMLAFLDGRI